MIYDMGHIKSSGAGEGGAVIDCGEGGVMDQWEEEKREKIIRLPLQELDNLHVWNYSQIESGDRRGQKGNGEI